MVAMGRAGRPSLARSTRNGGHNGKPSGCSLAALCSFDAFGGPNNGTQGGVLDITATLFPVGGTPVTGVPIEVVCRVNAPSGFTEEEGTSVDGFTEHTGGTTLFHLTGA
jgi:hypothetical protein